VSTPARWAHRRRKQLIRLLGGCCTKCGSSRKLEFHHTGARTWVARKKSRWMRMVLYWRDYQAGIIELLCRRCHCRIDRH
jgi:hypothetical protein